MENVKKCKCEKTAVDELLRTGMVGGPAQVFKRCFSYSAIKDVFHTVPLDFKPSKMFS